MAVHVIVDTKSVTRYNVEPRTMLVPKVLGQRLVVMKILICYEESVA